MQKWVRDGEFQICAMRDKCMNLHFNTILECESCNQPSHHCNKKSLISARKYQGIHSMRTSSRALGVAVSRSADS
jgi:hypothetical protein